MSPPMSPSKQVTALLSQARAGDPRAAEDLLPLVYRELRRLAQARLQQERPGQTLQATALVHEAYLRLVGDTHMEWNGRAHFFGAAAEAMRRILIDRARRKSSQRRGGELHRTELRTAHAPEPPGDASLLDLDRALAGLEENDAQMAAIVKLRYFAGLTVAETAAALELSTRTVNRNWRAAQAWLQRALEQGVDTDG